MSIAITGQRRALAGTTSQIAVNGLAFPGLSIAQAGVGYTLLAADGSLQTSVSDPFNVTAAAAAQFPVTAPGSAIVGAPFPFTVTALDVFGNTAAGYAGTLQFTTGALDAILPNPIGLTGGIGVFNATFNHVGNYTITATDANLLTGTSNVVNVTQASTAVALSSSAPISGFGTNVTLNRGRCPQLRVGQTWGHHLLDAPTIGVIPLTSTARPRDDPTLTKGHSGSRARRPGGGLWSIHVSGLFANGADCRQGRRRGDAVAVGLRSNH